MKKIIPLALCIVCLSLLFSACYIRELDTSKYYEYYPLESDTTYEELLSSSKDLGQKWGFANDWSIYMGTEKMADDVIMPKDLYKAALEDLEKILDDKTLVALQQPKDVSDFTAYVEKLLNQSIGQTVLSASFGTLVNNQMKDDDVYLSLLRLQMPDKTRVYVIACYKTIQEVGTKNYVCYSEDPDLIESICEWGEKYTVDSAQSGGLDPEPRATLKQ